MNAMNATNATCELGWNEADLFGALDGDVAEHGAALAHAARCPSCNAIAHVRARAKEAWSAALRRDDVAERRASEARLARAWPVAPRRSSPARTVGFALAFATVACAVGLGVGFRVGVTHGEPSPLATAAQPPLAAASATSGAKVSATPATSVESLPDAREPRLVAMSACAGCRAGAKALEPGMRVGDAISVPAGARLTLGFALGDSFVDPSAGADLEGPARARAATSSATLGLDRGSARVRAPGETVVEVPGGRLVSHATKGAIYTLMVDERGAAHVAVEAGSVTVTMKTARGPVVVEAGGVLEIPGVSPAAARAPAERVEERSGTGTGTGTFTGSAPAANDQESLAAARARFKGGDPDGAKESLAKLAASSDATVARRANFTLAEIELAGGQRDAARTRLEGLITAPEEGLAADAATLLARSFTGPDERASAWQRYLATSPRSPFRERAMLERAEALLDARRTADANRLLAELRSATLTPTQSSQLERLTFKARELR